MPYVYNGKLLREGIGWTDDNGVQHPSTWATAWTEAEKTERGLIYQQPPPVYDNRFYTSSGETRFLDDTAMVKSNGEPVLGPDGSRRFIKGLRTDAIELVKKQAAARLAPSDWMLIKFSEIPSYKVPVEILDYRNAVRKASNDIEAAIKAAATLDEFMALYDSPVGPDGPTGDTPVLVNWPTPPDGYPDAN